MNTTFFKNFIQHKYLLLSVATAFLAGVALLHPGLPPTHDGEYHVLRFYEFDRVLRSGEWYPRWAPDFNYDYGIPLFTFVYPLPNYMASFFHLLGADFIDSFKLEMLSATMIGGIFFYLYVKQLWGETAGFIASAFYSFSPYHFVDIYVRGSVGEVWAIGLFPFWLWAYTKYTRTNNVFYFLYSVIALTLIILSHNILGLMFFCFVFCYMFFTLLIEKQKIHLFLFSSLLILLSLGISSVFWMPALFETKYVEGLQIYDLQKNFPDFFQLLFPSWGTGFFDTNLSNQMSVQIGVANLLAVGIMLFSFFKNWRKTYAHKYLILFMLSGFVVTFFLLTPFSAVIWQKAPLLHYFQFPWRLLSLMILFCSFLAGSFFYKNRSKWWILLFLGILFITTYDYAHPTFYHLRTDSYYTTKSNFMDGTNSPGNLFRTIWTPVFTQKAPQKVSLLTQEGTVTLIKSTSTSKIFSAKLTNASFVTFPVSFYPSWQVVAPNKSLAVMNNNQGLLHVKLPKGTYSVVLRMGQTKLEVFAFYLSLFSFLFLLSTPIFSFFIVRKIPRTL